MSLTTRQRKILRFIVRDYIDTAKPISSDYLKRKYKLDISSSTIRNEMLKLTKSGFIKQVHTSSGRVPTNKSYEFIVNEILSNNNENLVEKSFLKRLETEVKHQKRTFDFINWLTETLSKATCSFVLFYLQKESIFWEKGLKEILKEPEFKNFKVLSNFFDFIDCLEQEIKNFEVKDFDTPKILIGKKIPFSKYKDFSLLVSSCYISPNHIGLITISGLNRMAYFQNFKILNSVSLALK